MIVSDSEKFVFIHNPKCGGMSCHNALLKFDTRENFFFEWKTINSEGKVLDMAHITPFQLRKFFPKTFVDVKNYLKFTFVRNPYDRFLSAVSQHLKLGSDQMRRSILSDETTFYNVASSFARTSLNLRSIENDHKLVHFRPQVNFINIDGRQWADLVFHLEAPRELQTSPVSTWLPDMAQKANPTSAFAEKGYDHSRLGSDAIAVLNDFYSKDFSSFGYDLISS